MWNELKSVLQDLYSCYLGYRSPRARDQNYFSRTRMLCLFTLIHSTVATIAVLILAKTYSTLPVTTHRTYASPPQPKVSSPEALQPTYSPHHTPPSSTSLQRSPPHSHLATHHPPQCLPMRNRRHQRPRNPIPSAPSNPGPLWHVPQP